MLLFGELQYDSVWWRNNELVKIWMGQWDNMKMKEHGAEHNTLLILRRILLKSIFLKFSNWKGF